MLSRHPVAGTAAGPAAPVLAVVGAGAAGTLVAIHLLRELRERAARADVVLIDPAPEVGQGVAFSTTDERHLLNVPVGQLSALAEKPEHLLDWARCRVDPDVSAADFLPRRCYGAYLAHTLDAEAGRCEGARLQRRRARAVALQPGADNRDRLQLSDGTTLLADGVVLAPGIFAPGTAWAPPALLSSRRFVADPWEPGVLDAVAQGAGDVLVVGTGLTMVDVAQSLCSARRTVHAVSRHGELPKVHAAHRRPAAEPAELPEDVDLDIAALRRAVEAHVRDTVRRYGDWRPAMDGLRPHIARLWARLCDDCRAEFLVRDGRRWDAHRHRMPHRTAEQIGRLRSSGQLCVTRGAVTAVDDDGSALLVHLSAGDTRRVTHVINCTGPLADITLSGDPLLTGLLADGRAVTGPLRMGVATDGDGRVRAVDDSVGSLWTLGAMRRGQLWESTAIQEIRAQAACIAAHLAAQCAATDPGHRRRTVHDPPLRRRGVAEVQSVVV